MIPTSRLKRIGIAKLRPQNANIGWLLLDQRGGGLLDGIVEFERTLPQ